MGSLKFGKIVEIDTAKALCRVEFEDHDKMVSYWLPVLHRKTLKDKEYWMPDLNEHVACLMDDKNEEGVILGAIYSKTDTPPVDSQNKYHMKFEDGTYIEYDKSSHKLIADVQGEAEINTTEEAKIIAQKDVTVKSSTMINIIAPGLSAKIENEAEFPGGMDGEYRGKLHIIGELEVTGPVNITGSTEITGSVGITGPVGVTGDINASGNIIDGGNNTNHHSHA